MPPKPSFDPDALMRRAIDVMRASRAERRTDDKIVPYVGAVLWKPDGTEDTASRSELRDGDHAEYTLLERKHGHEALDGAVVFATLEPCAPDARTPPKIGCSRRIVLARIRKVYIGIEDPDPLVAGRGRKYLEENGVEVEMFPRELQQEIREVNKDFLEQAVQRAKEVDEKSKVPKLSGLEDAEPGLALQYDFSIEALEDFASAIGVAEDVTSDEFARRLLRMGLMEETKDGLRPSGYGLILFGKAPEDVHHHVRLLATIHYPGGGEETRDFGGPLVRVPGAVEAWLGDKLPSVLDRSRMKRGEARPLPFEVVREGIVNALVHRDYDLEAAKIQVVVTPDVIEIKSPGGPVPPITLEQLNAFSAPMLSRNPRIQYVFNRLGLSEERGLGMKTLRGLQEKHGLPFPRYSLQAPYLVLTIYRHAEARQAVRPDGSPLDLAPTELEVWRLLLASAEPLGTSELGEKLDLDRRTIQRAVASLRDEGLIAIVGSSRGPNTKYFAK
jgi:ATP-dependent DNA helicase RecG